MRRPSRAAGTRRRRRPARARAPSASARPPGLTPQTRYRRAPSRRSRRSERALTHRSVASCRRSGGVGGRWKTAARVTTADQEALAMLFRTKGRTALTLLAVGAAIFVVAGGPATAGKLVTKNQVAPNAITTKAIANGAITADKLSKSLRKSLKGANGANGARERRCRCKRRCAARRATRVPAVRPARSTSSMRAARCSASTRATPRPRRSPSSRRTASLFTYDSLYPSPNYPLNTPSGQVVLQGGRLHGAGLRDAQLATRSRPPSSCRRARPPQGTRST